jgi:hypothetical protein
VCSGGVLLLDEASCLGVEEGVGGGRAHGPAGSSETTDVVVGREAIAGGGRLLGNAPLDWLGGGHCDRGYVCASIDRLGVEFICEESVCTAGSVGIGGLHTVMAVRRMGGCRLAG